MEGRERRSWDVTTYTTDADTQTAHKLNVYEIVPAAGERHDKDRQSSNTHMNTHENKQTKKQEVYGLMLIFACNFEMTELSLQLPKVSK